MFNAYESAQKAADNSTLSRTHLDIYRGESLLHVVVNIQFRVVYGWWDVAYGGVNLQS